MRRIGCIAVCWLAVMELARPSGVAADDTDPDLREIEPYFMLVIDTSGSMELRTDCACTSTYCEDCLPKCQAPPGAGLPPISEKNRWAVTLEALTGTFEDFKCTTLPRTPTNGASYDVDYHLPYHQPWSCSEAGKPCEYKNGQARQKANGILDLYGNRVRFGLMTFDGIATYVGANEEVPVGSYNSLLAKGVQGLWSYGRDPEFAYPGCSSTFKMNTGVRSAIATEGGLISLNSCPAPPTSGPVPPCPEACSGGCPSTSASIADDIQASLLRTRPFGGTPIAGALDDLLFHLQNDVAGDPFGTCRKRYGLLLTDGRPDADSRPECACNEDPKPNGGCPADGTNPKCPYPKAFQLADKLVGNDTAVQAQLERLFVVGMAVEDDSVRRELEELAEHGCRSSLSSGCSPLFAADFESLMSGLGDAIDQTLNGVSRSVPAFAMSRKGDVAQYMISTGFRKPTKPGAPWYGLLERKRYTCVKEALTAQPLTAAEGDLFHETLQIQKDGPDRNLVTVGLKSGADYDGALAGAACQPSPCDMVDLQAVAPSKFGAGFDATQVKPIVDWMTGAIGSPRDSGQALGDIYHGSPVVLSAPIFDTVDEGFNLFRREPLVARRPVTVFVNSNDGILHAFSVEDYKETPIGQQYEYSAGQEMWGFVPPVLINDLKGNLDSHKILLDGTPVIKDVYFDRAAGGVGTQTGGSKYHTVLITGMRGGGNAYIALDITNVHEPQFLWQFTDPYMGYTYGQPAIGQATWKQANGLYKHGAVAILPGGRGRLDASECAAQGRPSMRLDGDPDGTDRSYSLHVKSTDNHQHRANVRCWDTGPGDGRSLFFVDVETGQPIKTIRDVVAGTQPFPSPMVGTPAMYQTDIGSIASRAFMVDADGVVWRIDLSALDPKPGEPLKGWTALPFHDMFYNGEHDEGEYSYEAPVLSVDPDGHVVVIVGTGDTDDFVKAEVKNRVASLTEVVPELGSPLTPKSYKARLNWELRVPDNDLNTSGLVKSELVTGSMALYQGTLFLGSFISIGGSDACDLGRGRLHAVDYVAHDEGHQHSEGTAPFSFGPKVVDGGTISVGGENVLNVTPDKARKNFMAMGLSIVQRPTCLSVLTDESGTDLWGEKRAVIKKVQEPSLYLVSQASGSDSHVAKRNSSKLGTMELKLNQKPSYTRITSWTGSVD